jgi:asparagine synthase (glutamine-hydrolyzing)
MCGICGFFDSKGQLTQDKRNLIIRDMNDALYHRGPDDFGLYLPPGDGVSFGHRRLSIIDLSAEGHQPMESVSGRYVVVFNGEIYNYRDIRDELHAAGLHFRGGSDTEVLVQALELWGLHAVNKFIGMFAFAVWDKQLEKLHLVRDRAGEKPLFYGVTGDYFVFASELKALCKHPAFKKDINRNSLALYMRYAYIPAPQTIYRNTFKVVPGGIVTFSAATGSVESQQYWSLDQVINRDGENFANKKDEELVEEVEHLLKDAIRLQMVADVPVGAFLSGGVDSSTVVALMQSQSMAKVKTFSIGFAEREYDEAAVAKQVAGYLGTDHTELYVTPQEAMAVVPHLPAIYDEPFADSSQIPTLLVSQLARKAVTVSLSGDAGDELFGGYNRYTWAPRINKMLSFAPNWLLEMNQKLIYGKSCAEWDRFFGKLDFIPARLKYKSPGEKLYKIARIMDAQDLRTVYDRLTSIWQSPDFVLNADGMAANQCPPLGKNQPADYPTLMMYWDFITYLPNDILVKLDRAGMSVSLESRVPFLDHRLIELAFNLPVRTKLKGGSSKWILKQLLLKYIPQAIVERPKMGFGVPIDSWLRNELKDWADTLLSENALKKWGLLDPAPIRVKWQQHLSGKYNWQHELWNVLMFQAWANEWL